MSEGAPVVEDARASAPLRSRSQDSGDAAGAPMPREAPRPAGTARRRLPRVPWKLVATAALLFATVAGCTAALFTIVGSQLAPEVQAAVRAAVEDAGGLLLLLAAFVAVGVFLVVQAFFKAYVFGMQRLSEELRVVLAANASHRLPTDGVREQAELAGLINTFAARHQDLHADVEVRVHDAKARLEEERHRLAALMSELTESVLVCNREGLILLYNAAARALFAESSATDPGRGGLVGLGRSVFGVIDRELIAHALDLVVERLRQGESRPVSAFVTTLAGGRLIRAQMAPVIAAQGTPAEPLPTGFVLTLDDVTGTVAGSENRDRLIDTLAGDTRAGLASIRAAVEAVLEYQDMEPARREQFTTIIRDEAVRMSERLDSTLARYSTAEHPRWPLQEMQAEDLVQAIRRAIERSGAMQVVIQPLAAQRVSVDSFAVVQACTYVAGRLRQSGVRELSLALAPAGRFLRLEVGWTRAGTDPATLTGWENESFADADQPRLTLRDVAQRHGGEEWMQLDRDRGTVSYCMLLPLARSEPAGAPVAVDAGRPEFYDFDLFKQPGQTRELEGRLLSELTYTVFDTETTGLEPSAGDEIISLSAVRIVNGRLLRQEVFDQLVDPRRRLPRESTAIHGITQAMLEGQPTIERVLPRFARFAEDTVLVGHNVAFDMRFLQLKEELTGVRFIQPVLDTLLLSVVVHPNLEEHALEANAQRFGIPVLGRHTSLGDAMVTGEIFMKLIPLLAGRGILTLKDAITECERTFLARIRY